VGLISQKKLLANCGQVYAKRWDPPVASLGAVESQILVVHHSADLLCVYLWWASLEYLVTVLGLMLVFSRNYYRQSHQIFQHPPSKVWRRHHGVQGVW
jgi:hypothetical protein